MKRFSARKIKTGEWPTLGRLPGFSYEEWPMPVFTTSDLVPGTRTYAVYDEKDVVTCLRYYSELDAPDWVKIAPLAQDGSAGAEYVELWLEKVLQEYDGRTNQS